MERFRGRHEGESILVIGCGPSAKEAGGICSEYTTIACNDAASVAGLDEVDYQITADPFWNLAGRVLDVKTMAHFRMINDFGTPAMNWKADLLVDFHAVPMDRFSMKQISLSVLAHSLMTPFLAASLAAHMGAEKVGIIGMDCFAPGHEMSKPGNLKRVERDWMKFQDFYFQELDVFNCSEKSAIKTLPKQPISMLHKRIEQ